MPMKHKTKTSDYSQEEIAWFDEMHNVLTAYNASLGSDHELPLPRFSDKEMAELSGYRELLIAEEIQHHFSRKKSR